MSDSICAANKSLKPFVKEKENRSLSINQVPQGQEHDHVDPVDKIFCAPTHMINPRNQHAIYEAPDTTLYW